MKTLKPVAQVAFCLLCPGFSAVAGAPALARVAYAGFCLAMMVAKKSETDSLDSEDTYEDAYEAA